MFGRVILGPEISGPNYTMYWAILAIIVIILVIYYFGRKESFEQRWSYPYYWYGGAKVRPVYTGNTTYIVPEPCPNTYIYADGTRAKLC